jgi:RNA polymerase sigma-70 factor (ECF subfamily)
VINAALLKLAASPDENSSDAATARAADFRSEMDEATFETFYKETARPLRAYLERVGGDRGLADDLTQESFVRFLNAPRPEMSAPERRAYIYRIATNLLHDHWRRAKREGLRAGGAGDEGDAASRGRSDVYEEFAASDVRRIFRELKPQEQTLLWLAYVEESAHSEIAAALNLREKSVRVLLFRARKKLARILEERGLARLPQGVKR